eukprot:6183476-Pleurochrysis_carterae.AAC.3
MLNFPVFIHIACVLAERSRSAPHALERSLAHGRRRPLSTLARSCPVGARTPRARTAPADR